MLVGAGVGVGVGLPLWVPPEVDVCVVVEDDVLWVPVGEGELVVVGESVAFGEDVGLGEKDWVEVRVYTPYTEAIAIIPTMNTAAAIVVFFIDSTSFRDYCIGIGGQGMGDFGAGCFFVGVLWCGWGLVFGFPRFSRSLLDGLSNFSNKPWFKRI